MWLKPLYMCLFKIVFISATFFCWKLSFTPKSPWVSCLCIVPGICCNSMNTTWICASARWGNDVFYSRPIYAAKKHMFKNQRFPVTVNQAEDYRLYAIYRYLWIFSFNEGIWNSPHIEIISKYICKKKTQKKPPTPTNPNRNTSFPWVFHLPTGIFLWTLLRDSSPPRWTVGVWSPWDLHHASPDTPPEPVGSNLGSKDDFPGVLK